MRSYTFLRPSFYSLLLLLGFLQIYPQSARAGFGQGDKVMIPRSNKTERTKATITHVETENGVVKYKVQWEEGGELKTKILAESHLTPAPPEETKAAAHWSDGDEQTVKSLKLKLYNAAFGNASRDAYRKDLEKQIGNLLKTKESAPNREEFDRALEQQKKIEEATAKVKNQARVGKDESRARSEIGRIEIELKEKASEFSQAEARAQAVPMPVLPGKDTANPWTEVQEQELRRVTEKGRFARVRDTEFYENQVRELSAKKRNSSNIKEFEGYWESLQKKRQIDQSFENKKKKLLELKEDLKEQKAQFGRSFMGVELSPLTYSDGKPHFSQYLYTIPRSNGKPASQGIVLKQDVKDGQPVSYVRFYAQEGGEIMEKWMPTESIQQAASFDPRFLAFRRCLENKDKAENEDKCHSSDQAWKDAKKEGKVSPDFGEADLTIPPTMINPVISDEELLRQIAEAVKEVTVTDLESGKAGPQCAYLVATTGGSAVKKKVAKVLEDEDVKEGFLKKLKEDESLLQRFYVAQALPKKEEYDELLLTEPFMSEIKALLKKERLKPELFDAIKMHLHELKKEYPHPGERNMYAGPRGAVFLAELLPYLNKEQVSNLDKAMSPKTRANRFERELNAYNIHNMTDLRTKVKESMQKNDALVNDLKKNKQPYMEVVVSQIFSSDCMAGMAGLVEEMYERESFLKYASQLYKQKDQ